MSELTPIKFTVFTLNCWGIRYISKDVDVRLQAIATFLLCENSFDVVCLQEVWSDCDFNTIKARTARLFPYAHYFYSGVNGSGICVLSKHPITEVFYHQWPVNGYIHKIHHGDWFGGKGVGLCKLKVNNLDINVYSAHLHAEYDRNCDEYEAHRVLQAFDTAQFIKVTSGDADLVVLAGDLNTEPDDLACKIILAVPGLVDAFSEASEQSKQRFATNESPENSYTPVNLVKKNFPGKRIDYIMYSSAEFVKVNVNEYWLPLPSRIPGFDFSFSDHEGVASCFLLDTFQPSIKKDHDRDVISVLEASIDICNTALDNLVKHKNAYIIYSIILLILLVTTFILDVPCCFMFFKNLLKVAVSGALFFTVLMATIWNRIEKNGILSTKLSMELNLKLLKVKKQN